MKKLIILLLLVILSIPVVSAGASSWSFGYRVGVDGYVAPTLGEQEYWAISAFTELFPQQMLRPRLEAGVLVSRNSDVQMMVSLGSGLFVVQDHLFERFFRRDSALIPRIDAAVAVSTGNWHPSFASMLIQPLSFHFGDKYIGILGVHLLYDIVDDSWGWGIRLFELNHYLW